MSPLWDRYQQYLLRHETLGISLDISRMRFGDDFLGKVEPLAQQAFASMKAFESGAIANPDEKRMVGEDAEAVFHTLNHLAANDSRVRQQTGRTAGADTFVLA